MLCTFGSSDEDSDAEVSSLALSFLENQDNMMIAIVSFLAALVGVSSVAVIRQKLCFCWLSNAHLCTIQHFGRAGAVRYSLLVVGFAWAQKCRVRD